MIAFDSLIKPYENRKITISDAKQLLDNLKAFYLDKHLIIWGVAGTGKFYGELFIDNGISIEYFVDRNADMVRTLFDIPVVHPDILFNIMDAQYSVLIAGSSYTVKSIINEIDSNRYKILEAIDGNKHFNIMQECARLMRVQHSIRESKEEEELTSQIHGWLSIPFFELVVTTFCTLRCRHCAHFNAHYYFMPEGKKKLRHFSVEELEATVQKILLSVDEIKEISVVGGEPFLHPDLHKILNQLKMSSKIKRIEIATNATFCPQGENLESLVDDKIYVTISDYGSLSNKREELKGLFNAKHIKHRVQVQGYGWDDLGEHYWRNRTNYELDEIYANCFDTRYKIILDNNIYDCHRVANAVNLGYYAPDESEYVDVLNTSVEDIRKRIGNLYLLKHIPYCNYCNGKGLLVSAAIQYTKEEIRQLREQNDY